MNVHVKSQGLEASARRRRRPRLLMCAPEHFGVDYVINPWMKDQIGRTDHARARRQWDVLRRRLARHAELTFAPSAPGLPDMPFTANAGLVLDGVAAVSRFQARERRPEERLFRRWFELNEFAIAPWPEDVAFEGAGDALPDHARGLIWCGHGWRTSRRAPPILENTFGRRAVALRLVDPRFYHLDTCLCPLSDGWLLYYPAAFDEVSLKTIRALTPAEQRLEVCEADAAAFACNAVEIDRRIFMNGCSPDLGRRLDAAGFAPTITPLTEFLKAGGAAKCLTLELHTL
jgi:N-dimethylarginine dimethylaminohydrolase